MKNKITCGTFASSLVRAFTTFQNAVWFTLIMEKTDLKLPTDKKFGLFFTGVFLLAGVWSVLVGGKEFFLESLILATVFFLATILRPSALRPLNYFWMKLGQLLGKVCNPIVLGVLYFGIFTPVGLFLRLTKRDELRLAFAQRPTYWIYVHTDDNRQKNLKDQF